MAGSKASKRGGKKKKEKPNRREIEEALWANHVAEREHLYRNIKPAVDDKPPKLNVGIMYNQTTLKKAARTAQDLDISGKLILRAINIIDRTHGETGTLNINIAKKVSLSMDKKRFDQIEKANFDLGMKLVNARTSMETVGEYAKRWDMLEQLMAVKCEYPLFWKTKEKVAEPIEVAPPRKYFKQHVTEKSAKYPNKRPRVQIELAITGTGSIGKFVVELFSDYVPKTVKNFLAFCEKDAPLSYKNTRLHLIFEGYFAQMGDVVENKGFGGTSIYGPYFINEDHTLRHGQRGVLTTHQRKPNRNTSQFLITFKPLKALDGTNVVFGKTIKGHQMIEAIESSGSKVTGRPKFDLYISNIEEI